MVQAIAEFDINQVGPNLELAGLALSHLDMTLAVAGDDLRAGVEVYRNLPLDEQIRIAGNAIVGGFGPKIVTTAAGRVRAALPRGANAGAIGGAVQTVADFRSTKAAFSHYAKHVKGVELGPGGSTKVTAPDLPEFSSFAKYRAAAQAFMGGGTRFGVLEGIRPGGDLVRLDPVSGHFGIRAASGEIRTFFRPEGGPLDWLAYFQQQFVP